MGRSAFAVPPSKMCDWGGLDEKDRCQGAGGVDGPPLGVEVAPSGVPAGGAAGDDDDDGGISGWRARVACLVSSSMVSMRLAASEYPSGMPAPALRGAVGPGLVWPLPWALSFRWADRYS